MEAILKLLYGGNEKQVKDFGWNTLRLESMGNIV